MNDTCKPPGNVVDLIPSRLNDLLDAFKANGSLSDFLRVLDVLSSMTVDVPEVWQTWNRLNREVSGQGAVRSVLVWKSTLDFSACSSDAEANHAQTESTSSDIQSSQIDIDMEVVRSASDLAVHEQEITDYIQARIKDPSYPYGLFVPALLFEHILPKYPVIDEAARVIGQYIKAFFGDVEEITDDSSATPVRHPGIHRFIDDDLIPWALDAERRHWQSDPGPEADCRLAQLERLEEIRPFLIADLYLSKPDTFPPGFSLATLARAIPYLPQEEIEALVLGEEFNDEFLEREGCAELVYVLLSLPLSKPFGSWDQYEKSVPVDSLLREYAQDVYYIHELPTLSLELYEKLIFDLGVVNRTYITSAIQLSDEEDALTLKRLRALIESGIKRLTDVRRIEFAGKSPFDQQSATYMGAGMDCICEELEFTPRHDISYLIGVDVDDTGKGFGLCSFFSYVRNPEKRFGRARSENLILAFDAAIDEGWDEFATTSLTFYLFSQPILYDGELHADWHRLSQILRVAVNLPGAERVRHAAALAVEIIRGKGKGGSLDALCLSGWAQKDAEDLWITPDIPDRVLNLRQIVKDLIEQIGNEAWLKLSLQGKRQLQDAENLWSLMYMQFGRGTGDFGLVATAYVKVFEGEIMERMSRVTSTPTFEAYYRQTYKKAPEQHIGLGPLLHLLKNFERLPVELQGVILETNIRLHEDKKLINDLSKSMQYRNKGAHAGPFNEKQFIELRKLVFEDKSLKRFIDLL